MTLFICIFKWVNCLDVRYAYLYGDIDKEIYIKQPDGYKIKESLMLQFNFMPFIKLAAAVIMTLGTDGFKEIEGVPCIFTYKDQAIILVYVDDLSIFSKDQDSLNEVIQVIKSIYDVKELENIKMLLGIEFHSENNLLKNLNCNSISKNV